MAGGALAQVLRAGAQVGFAVAAGGVVDGEGDHRNPGGLHAPQDLFADVPRIGRVELMPDWAAEGLVDVFDGGRGRRRQNLQSAARFGCPGDGQFAFGEERFFTARRAQEDRAVVDGAEQLDAHVDLGGVAQAARAQLHVLVPFAIGAQRGVVVDAAGHVSPMAGHDLAVSGLLEIEDVESVGRVGNDVGSFWALWAKALCPQKAATPPSAAT